MTVGPGREHNEVRRRRRTEELPPIAGFWRRLVAFLIDGAVISGGTLVIGWLFRPWFFAIGPYGRFVGLGILLAYFGLLNSAVGRGQTVGKRLLKTAVRGRDGKPIGLGRSFLRLSILALPMIVNRWQLPLFQHSPAAGWVLSGAAAGLAVALVYTMIFNRRTRQGLHDMLCGTYVVEVPSERRPIELRAPRRHWVISGVLVSLGVLALVGTGLAGSRARTTGALGEALAPMESLYRTLVPDGRFFTVSVSDKTSHSNQRDPIRILTIQAWCRGRPTQEQQVEMMEGLAQRALSGYERIDEIDLIEIDLVSAFDLGLANGHLTTREIQPPAVWRQRAR